MSRLANLDQHLRKFDGGGPSAPFTSAPGATMIYVTHDQAEAMALATDVAVMSEGKFFRWRRRRKSMRGLRVGWSGV